MERFGLARIGVEVDDHVALRSPSVSVGDYVKAIWEVAGSGAASTKDVAGRLSIAPPSVTNMFARLQEMGLVEYERYRGASLTERGRGEALRLVRRHRLIETFLLEHLGYSWEEVHEEAERLEHAVSDGFTERLAEFLDHPGHDPHGGPIPTADGTLEPDDSFPLSESPVGGRVPYKHRQGAPERRARSRVLEGLLLGLWHPGGGRAPFDRELARLRRVHG